MSKRGPVLSFLGLIALSSCTASPVPPSTDATPAAVTARATPTRAAPTPAAGPDARLAFLRDGELVVLDMGTGEETATGITGIRPVAWIADGSALVAIDDTADELHSDAVVLQPIDGGEATLLVGTVLVGELGRRSPDGRFLAFGSDGAAPNGLVLVDLETGDATRATDDGATTTVWSPDGSRIAYEAADPATGWTDLYVYDLASGVSQRLTNDEWEDTPFDWSDDGSAVLTTSHRGGDGTRLSTSVWRIDARNGAMQHEENVGVIDYALRSPNRAWDARVSDLGWLLVTPAGRKIGSRVDQVDIGVHLTWSPNSAWLVWTALDDGRSSDLFLVRAPDGEPIQLTDTPGSETHPVWGPISHGF